MFACNDGSCVEAEMADVFSIDAEVAAVFAEIFRMRLSEFIQTAVALEVLAALAAAVGIDVTEQA